MSRMSTFNVVCCRPRTLTDWRLTKRAHYGDVYDHPSGLQVISTVIANHRGIFRHISLSLNGGPPNDEMTQRMIHDFGAEGFYEDSESRDETRARHFFEHKK